MPKRIDIKSVLVIGSGPIVIGQACEFDYAGTQACLALKEEGIKVILVNSNPATIMTDPEFSDVTYIEPLTLESLSSIIEKERPDALLPTMGGQTALNLTIELHKKGVLSKYQVTVIGASLEAICRAEDRELFHQTMCLTSIDVPSSEKVRNIEEAKKSALKMGFPLIARTSFSLGGSQCIIAYNLEELISLSEKIFQVEQELHLDEALVGWKEYELEVIRDKNDNCIVVCSIENLDPLGIHSGDSITVSPLQTLSDKEYQKMRNLAFQVLRAIGLETGGANVQFGVHPKTGRIVVIEINPRVSRSSALASKATGFPIAKVSAKLAIGYSLDELKNTMTKGLTPASFEPTMDYIVVKIPYFQFEKFPKSPDILGPQMRSIGEVMALGGSFSEALLKAMRSLEVSPPDKWDLSFLSIPNSKRLWHLFTSFRLGMSMTEVHNLTHINPWFLEEIKKIIEAEKSLELTPESIRRSKRLGLSDAEIARLYKVKEGEIAVRHFREKWNIQPVFKRVDSCSAEFATDIAYLYATYERFCEAKPSNLPKVIILGSGANRIGQGIEFDYCSVRAIKALKEMNYETIMINCNPETVSTDYDFADRLYCSPLTMEDLIPILKLENPLGILLQFGGQTPLHLARSLESHVPILGINTSIIDLCENRTYFKDLLDILQLKQPFNSTLERRHDILPDFFYPLILRPSFVLGGTGMQIVKNKEELELYLEGASNYPILIEQFLDNALEVDIDVICDGKEVFIPAIMEQLEPTGIHSGDSTSYIPSLRIPPHLKKSLINHTEKIAIHLKIRGVLNIQFAIWKDTIYVLEVNPRASRTLPFLSKATGLDLVKISIQCIMGLSLQELGYSKKKVPLTHFFVKTPIFPHLKLGPITLGPEMKSTGEVMGIGTTFQEACKKAREHSYETPLKPPQSLQEIYQIR